MIIFGSRGFLQVLTMVNFVCNNCHNPAAQRIVKRVTKFTLFFIPLFPVSTSYTSTCTFCGVQTSLTKELAEQYVAYAQGSAPAGNQPAQTQQPAYGNAGIGPVQEQIQANPGYGQQS